MKPHGICVAVAMSAEPRLISNNCERFFFLSTRSQSISLRPTAQNEILNCPCDIDISSGVATGRDEDTDADVIVQGETKTQCLERIFPIIELRLSRAQFVIKM